MANTARPIAYRELTQEDLKDSSLAQLNAILRELVEAVNYLQGASGNTALYGTLDLNGSKIINVGPKKTTLG